MLGHKRLRFDAWPAANRHNGPMIGEPVRRFEDARLLTGAGSFADDFSLPGQVHAGFVRSPHAFAEIASIDPTQAMRMPGTLAVVTAADLEADGVGPIPTGVAERGALYPNRDGSIMADPPYFPLARGCVRHVGDPLAMVVARDPAALEDAIAAVAVSYDPRGPVVRTEAASAANAPLIWEQCPSNFCFDWEAGDPEATEAGLARAHAVVTLKVVDNRIASCFLEPRAALAAHDARSGRYEIRLGCQGVHELRDHLAASLGIAHAALRVISHDVGGGFGSRNFAYPEYVAILWAARKLACPVKWRAGRSEEFLSTMQGRDYVLEGRLGIDAGGNFTALRVEGVCAMGAYHATQGPFSALRNLTRMLSGVYRIPTVSVRLQGVFTNTVPVTSYRGVGRIEAVYLLERLVEDAAIRLGRDRIALRRQNLIPAAALPYRSPTGAVYDSGDYAANLEAALAEADWPGFAGRRADSVAAGKCRGIALGTYIEGAGGVGGEYAAVQIHRTGAVRLAAGCVAQGQGHETTLRQIAGATLGVPAAAITLVAADTDLVAEGVGTHASRSMVRAGPAVMEAARLAIEDGMEAASELLEAAPADIAFSEGCYRVAGTDRSIGIGAVAARRGDGGLAGRSRHRGDAITYPNGCHVCEVEIDPETGMVEILAFTAIDDVGRAINPMIVHGQSQGGIAQGIGQSLLERMVYDQAGGQPLSGSFLDYAIPRAADLPAIKCVLNEVPSPTNPLGVKGAGEGGTTGAPGAVILAILDALRPLGVGHIDMPATPERVWRAIRGAAGD